MVTTRIHINQHNIRANKKTGTKTLPVITVKDYRQNRKGNYAEILDAHGNIAARIIYRPEKPLDCGATVWIETTNEVNIT